MSNEPRDRDKHGRFLPNNRWSSAGGNARALKLSRRRRREIAAMGFQAMVDRYFNGDRKAATKWLSDAGLYFQDSDLRSIGKGIYKDPGPHPGKR
jgi:hypothetical protein